MGTRVGSCAGVLLTLGLLGGCGNDGLEPIEGRGDADSGSSESPRAKPSSRETSDAGADSDIMEGEPEPSAGPVEPEPEPGAPTGPSGTGEDPTDAGSNGSAEPEPGPDGPGPTPDPDGGGGPSSDPEPEPEGPDPDTPDPAVRVVPVIFRDFSATHPDFGFDAGTCGSAYPTPGMVAASLDADGRPVLASNPLGSCVESSETFANWYRDGDNVRVMGELELYDNGAGGLVNRFGPNGEQFRVAVGGPNETPVFATDQASCAPACESRTRSLMPCDDVCETEADELRAANDVYTQAETEGLDEATLAQLEAEVARASAAYEACTEACAVDGAALTAECTADCKPCSYSPTDWCIGGEYAYVDGTPLFFPVDGVTGPTADLGPARLPEQYGFVGWPWEADVFGAAVDHNFYFTTELHQSFRFEADTSARLDFTGDDDVWVFVNGVLAIDLGGTHVPLDGSVTIDAGSAATFGLVPGNVYDVAVFHAERMMEGSSFRLTLTGFVLE